MPSSVHPCFLFVLAIIVIFMNQRNKTKKVNTEQREAGSDFVLPTSEAKSTTTIAETKSNVSKHEKFVF